MKVESLDLEITRNCNLSCSYCYAHVDAKENCGDKYSMTDENIELVFDLIEKDGYPRPVKFENGRVKQTQITFYGGEPLLAFHKVKHVVERSRERGMQLKFSLLSNGTTGTEEQFDWCKANNIWIQRSIDGCPEAQEKYRPNSIAKYEEKTKLYKDYGSSRRMTIQPEFAKDLMKSIEYFESQGFWAGQSPMPNFYTEWTDEHVEDLKKSMWAVGQHYLKRWHENKAFYNYYLSREMYNRFAVARNEQHGCGGGIGLWCVNWDGWMYMCHRFACEEHDHPFCLGHIKDVIAGTAKGFPDFITKQVELHKENNPKNWRSECKDCIAQYNCEKGCMHTNYLCKGELNCKPPRPYCEVRQEAAKIVTWLDSKLRSLDSEWWMRGNHLAQNYKPNIVASNLIMKGFETMMSRMIEQNNQRNKGDCKCQK